MYFKAIKLYKCLLSIFFDISLVTKTSFSKFYAKSYFEDCYKQMAIVLEIPWDIPEFLSILF